MSTNVKYNNEFGQEINNLQAKKLEYYSKIFVENNLPFKEETYKNGNLINTSYYIGSQSQIETLLLINSQASFDLIYQMGNYKIHELLSYTNSKLISKRVLVYNSNEKNIYFRTYKQINNDFIPEQTEKYFYDIDQLKFSFEYNNDGTCFIIRDEVNYQSDIFAWNIGNLDYTDFTWADLEYYKNADPMIPC